MDGNFQSSIPSQNEVPVSDVNPKPNPSPHFDFSKVKIKSLGIGLLVILVVVVLGLFLFKPKGNKSSPTDPIYSKAQEAASQGKYDDAKKFYSDILTTKKNDPVALSGIITSISQQGNQTGSEVGSLKESQSYIDQALQSNPNDSNVLMAAGYAYETAGDYQKALDYYTQATKADPNSSEAWFHEGHVLQFLNRSDEGYQDYNKSYQLDKTNSLAAIAIANRLYTEKKTQAAFDMFQQASNIPGISSQNKADALAAAANIRRDQDNFAHMDEALTLSKQAITADPTFSPALASYGFNIFITGDPTNGEVYMKKAIAANPRISRNYSSLGYLLRGVKRYADSINYQKDAIAHVKDDNTLLTEKDKSFAEASYTYELAKTYSMSGVSTDTTDLLSHALSLNPSLKQSLVSDYNSRNIFRQNSNNPDFQKLIK